MRKIFIFLTLAVSLLFAASAQAAEMRIFFFNIGTVAEKSDAYKAQMAKFKTDFEAEGQKLQQELDAWQKKVDDFQKQQQALAPVARVDRETTLTIEKNNLDAKMNAYGRKRQAAEVENNNLIQSVIAYAAQEVAKREKYTALIEQNRAGVLVMDPQYDVSDTVLAEANKVWRDKPRAVFGQ